MTAAEWDVPMATCLTCKLIRGYEATGENEWTSSITFIVEPSGEITSKANLLYLIKDNINM